MEAISRLIDTVYEATVDDEAYGAVAEGFSRLFDASTTWAMEHSPAGVVTIGSAWQMSDHIEAYEEYYWRHDLWRQRSVYAPLNEATNCERLVSQQEMAESEMYNDFIKPSGNQVFHCLGIMLTTPSLALTGIGIQRQRRQAAFNEDDERLLQTLQPHLSRMAAARWRIRLLGDRLAQAEDQLNQDLDAVFRVDAMGRVLWRNAAAGALPLDAPIGASAAGRLVCAHAEDGRRLAGAVASATQTCPAGAMLGLGAQDGSDRWWAAVDPGETGVRRTAVVRIRDRDSHARRQADAAKTAFRLSPVEALVAEALLRGLTLEAYALKRGVSIATVRAQFSAILQKSGADRQASFATLASTLPV